MYTCVSNVCNRGHMKLVSGCGDGRYRRGGIGGTRSQSQPPAGASTKERKRKRVTVHISQCIHPRAQNLKGLSRGVSSYNEESLPGMQRGGRTARPRVARGAWRAWHGRARHSAAGAQTQNHRSNAVVARRPGRRATRQL